MFFTPRAFMSKIRKNVDMAIYVGQRVVGYPAAWCNRRLSFRTIVIGITGSAGKTTTKDICLHMLSEFGTCGATKRSMNERFAVAKNLLNLRWFQRYFVVEMSGGNPGLLSHSMRLVNPQVGVLTNIGRDHYKAFKGVEGIAQEKAKIVRLLREDGVAVLNIDDPQVRAIGESSPRRKVWVGRAEEADVRLIEVESKWPAPLALTVEYRSQKYRIKTNLHGEHLAPSVLCALGVAVALDLPLDKAVAGIAKAEPAEGRMQIVEGEDGVVFIRDDWKAPDWTLQAPLEYLRDAQARRKVAIIGTLSDFSGDNSTKYKQAAKRVKEVADLTVFVGRNAHRALRARTGPDDTSLVGFERIVDAAHFLKQEIRTGDVVLLKGSAKADHLVRLLYDRYKPVQCWKDPCGLNRLCGSCPALYKPPAQNNKSDGSRQIHAMSTPLYDELWGNTEGKPVVVVGLGNPGLKYDETPHNVGYKVVERVAGQFGGVWRECPEGKVIEGQLSSDCPVILFKPSTKMNLSGEAVKKFLLKLGGHPEKCIIVHDDMDVKLGDARLKYEGSSAGHNGVKSVLIALGTNSVPRVRVGVRTSEERVKAKEMVLASFSPEDKEGVEAGIQKALDLITQAVDQAESVSA